MTMKTILYLFLVIIIISSCESGKNPKSGEWKGEGISFTVEDNSETIIKLEVVIPHGDEFLAQWYENLKIDEDNKFYSFQDGNSYLGIPKRDLKGEFISSKFAEGTFNGIEWEAKYE